MNLRVSWCAKWLIAPIGVALTLVGLSLTNAHAYQKTSGNCGNDGSQGCPQCGNGAPNAQPSNAQPSYLPLYIGCTGPLNLTYGYSEGTCDNNGSAYCSNATYSCGAFYNCRTGKILGNCGSASYCANTVLV